MRRPPAPVSDKRVETPVARHRSSPEKGGKTAGWKRGRPRPPADTERAVRRFCAGPPPAARPSPAACWTTAIATWSPFSASSKTTGASPAINCLGTGPPYMSGTISHTSAISYAFRTASVRLVGDSRPSDACGSPGEAPLNRWQSRFPHPPGDSPNRPFESRRRRADTPTRSNPSRR